MVSVASEGYSREVAMLALLRVAAVVAMTSCSFSAAAAAADAAPRWDDLLAVRATTLATTTVDNTKPRTDTEGNIVNDKVHMTRFQVAGEWRYYWVGSAWAPCEPVNGKCVDGQRHGTSWPPGYSHDFGQVTCSCNRHALRQIRMQVPVLVASAGATLAFIGVVGGHRRLE